MDKEKNTEQQEKELFGNLEIKYSRSKEEVWKSMEALMAEEEPESPFETMEALPGTPAGGQPGRIAAMNTFRVSIAAAVTLLIGLTLFARFHTQSVDTAAGVTASLTLPDGSAVQLNGDSHLSYAPYWWRFSRKVDLAGEAFFEVENGRNFTVHSEQGFTEVLGTSFNILAREKIYEVYCATGKVRVTDSDGAEVTLAPGEFARRSDTEALNKREEAMEAVVLSWRSGSFLYNTTPLSKVFMDVERHYKIDLDITVDGIDTLSYTGKFDRGESAEDALEIICFSFGLAYEKTGGDSYSVRAN
jgi:ferric-dicitrate binding protein FerR (iron transport regulator)